MRNRSRAVRAAIGEEIVFETDAGGDVTAMIQHANRWPRMDLSGTAAGAGEEE